MILEQSKLCLKIEDKQGLVSALDGKLSEVLKNLKIK
jgi:hypothetical protein